MNRPYASVAGGRPAGPNNVPDYHVQQSSVLNDSIIKSAMCLFVAGVKNLECSGTFQSSLDSLLLANKLPSFSLGNVVPPNFSLLTGLLGNSVSSTSLLPAASSSAVPAQSGVGFINSTRGSLSTASDLNNLNGSKLNSSAERIPDIINKIVGESSIVEDESFIDEQFNEVVNARRSLSAVTPSPAATVPVGAGVSTPDPCLATVAAARGGGGGRGRGRGRGRNLIARYQKRSTRTTTPLAINESFRD
jgi:hypothetical protein